MTPARHRLFVLLGAYEDLTDRETSALRRGDIQNVLSIQERKGRLTEVLQDTRRSVELSTEDSAAWNDRVRLLSSRESENLDVLRGHMTQVRHSLAEIGQAAQRSRKVRRGYTGLDGQRHSGVAVLGRA